MGVFLLSLVMKANKYPEQNKNSCIMYDVCVLYCSDKNIHKTLVKSDAIYSERTAHAASARRPLHAPQPLLPASNSVYSF